jgi:hypothetical protein
MDDCVLYHWGFSDRVLLAEASLRLWNERVTHRRHILRLNHDSVLTPIERRALISRYALTDQDEQELVEAIDGRNLV